MGTYVTRSRKGDKVEPPERESGDICVKQFEPTVLERLTAEDWACLQEWLEMILGHAHNAAQQVAEMGAYFERCLRHQNN